MSKNEGASDKHHAEETLWWESRGSLLPAINHERVAAEVWVFAEQAAAGDRESVEEAAGWDGGGGEDGALVHGLEKVGVEFGGGGGALRELSVEEFDRVRAGGEGSEGRVGTGSLRGALDICGSREEQEAERRFVGGEGFVTAGAGEEGHVQAR
jgi:hypothetical protein